MENNAKPTIIKKHLWLPDEEKFLIETRDATIAELKDLFFPDVSVAAIRYKLRRLLDEERYHKTGPWSDDELSILRANLNLSNAVIRQNLHRTDDDINTMRWAMKHGRSTRRIGPRRRYRFAYSTGNTQLQLAKCAIN